MKKLMWTAAIALATGVFANCAKPQTDAEQNTLVSGNFFGRTYLQPVVSFADGGNTPEICWYQLTERWKFKTLTPEEVPGAFKKAVETGSKDAVQLTANAVTLESMASEVEKLDPKNPMRSGIGGFLGAIAAASKRVQDISAFLEDKNVLGTLVQIVGVGAAFVPKLAALLPVLDVIEKGLPAVSGVAGKIGEGAGNFGGPGAELTPEEKDAYRAELIAAINDEIANPQVLHRVKPAEMKAFTNVIRSAGQSSTSCPGVF